MYIGECRIWKTEGASTSTKEKDTIEYLMENCKCICLVVQRNNKGVGYLLSTKIRKNFLLVA